MPSNHLTELTPADASLLREERAASAHMHVGGIALLEGRPPSIGDLRAHVLRRLQRVPRYRTTVVPPPLGIGRPHWAVDPNFNIDYHVRHVALPSPGDEDELLTAAARLYSQRLDRRRPLWELWVVEGLEGGRFAVVTKSHQALVDGIVSADLMTALMDPEPSPADPPPDPPSTGRWLAPPLPSSAQLVASAVRDAGRLAVSRPLRLAGALARPAEALAGAAGLGGRVSERLKPAPPSPLNVPIGPHRRLARAAVPVADLKLVKDTFGGTVNDVVLAIVAGAVREWMADRGLRTEGVELRAAVPIAVEKTRARQPRPIALLHAPLPIGEPDPLVRFERIRRAMSENTAGRHALTGERLITLETFSPPSTLARVSRLQMDTRRFNLVVGNVPGPQEAMFLLGRRLETTIPVPFLSGDRALAVAVTSYAGTAEFGLLGDLDKLADIDVVATGIGSSMDELLALARRGRRARRVRRTAPPTA